jgi:hypothetical protein
MRAAFCKKDTTEGESFLTLSFLIDVFELEVVLFPTGRKSIEAS